MKKNKLVIFFFLFFTTAMAFAETSTNSTRSNYKDSPFGFHYANNLSNYTGDLGIKWVRVNAVWDIIQKEKDIINGDYNWDAFENHTKLNSYPENINFIITISILGTPVAGSGSYIPDDGVYTEESWIKYTKALVNKYNDRVKYWQVENEPKPNMKDYAELQKITYKAIKEECSKCQVLMGGFLWARGSIKEFDKINNPILQELNGEYVDIYDQHYGGNAKDYNTKTFLDYIKKRLKEANFNETPIWITEMSDYSGDPKEKMKLDPPYQSEQVQAQSLFKRYVSSISYGVEKVFWAFGIIEGFHYDESYFDFTGLIYDGKYNYDMGYGVKKLAYYTYKLMVEKLEGSDWDNIQTIQESNNIYIYRFIKNGAPVWVAWNDDSSDKTISLDVGNINSAKVNSDKVTITTSIPDAENGAQLTQKITFKTKIKQIIEERVFISLDANPVYVEEGEVSSPVYEVEKFVGSNSDEKRRFPEHKRPFDEGDFRPILGKVTSLRGNTLVIENRQRGLITVRINEQTRITTERTKNKSLNDINIGNVIATIPINKEVDSTNLTAAMIDILPKKKE